MKTTDEKIMETLDALSGIKRATAPPDFETNLGKRLQFIKSRRNWFQYSAAALVLFTILNLLTAMSISADYTPTATGDPMEEPLFDEELYSIINLSAE